MTKNVKLAYLLSLFMFAISIAWKTLSAFFSGVGISFVAMLAIMSIMVFLFVADKDVRSRTFEICIALAVLLLNEIIVFMAFEFFDVSSIDPTLVYLGAEQSSAYDGFTVYQTVLSILSMVCFVWTMVRFMLDVKGVKLHFVEVMLGNEKRYHKIKESKELSNGSLEHKPNKISQVEETEEPSVEDNDIVVEESEE